MSEAKVESKYIDKDPPMGTEQQLERKNNDYLAYLKEKLNFILATYGRRLTDADGHVNELIRTAAEFAIRLSQKVNGDEIISAINASPEQITIQSNRINLVGMTFVNGAIVSTYTRVYNHNDYSQADLDKIAAYVNGAGTLTDADWDKYDINEDGAIRMSDLIIIRNMILNSADITKTVVTTIDPSANGQAIKVEVTCTGSYSASWTAVFAGRRIEGGGINGTSVTGTESLTTLGTVYVRNSNNMARVVLDDSALSFRDANGTVTATYPNTGISGGSDIEVQSYSKSVGTIAAGGSGSIDFNIAKTGYTPIGITGIWGSGTTGMIWNDWFLVNDSTARVWYKNSNGSSVNLSSLSIKVLYKKN